MPTVCFFKNCKSISDKHTDKVFVPFVKPYSDIRRCKRWIQLSGRPSISVDKITKNTYLCSDHFDINEVLDWKKNPKLDPIPFHRLKKVTREEVFRHHHPNPHSVFFFGKFVTTANNSNCHIHKALEKISPYKLAVKWNFTNKKLKYIITNRLLTSRARYPRLSISARTKNRSNVKLVSQELNPS